MNEPRLTISDIKKACNYDKIKNYPFVNILPFTKPSAKAIAYDKMMFNNKKALLSKKKYPTIYEFRNAKKQSGFELKNNYNNPLTTIKRVSIPNKYNKYETESVSFDILSYPQSNINNGV